MKGRQGKSRIVENDGILMSVKVLSLSPQRKNNLIIRLLYERKVIFIKTENRNEIFYQLAMAIRRFI